MKRILRFLAGLVLFCSGNTVNAQEKDWKSEAAVGVTMVLPGNWESIPQEELRLSAEQAQKKNPSVPKQAYDCGYRDKTSREFPSFPPYIVVQANRCGRVSEDHLKSVRKLATAWKDAVAEVKDKSVSKSGEPLYDEAKHIVWLQMDEGKIRILIATLLTEEGVFYVYCYASDTDFAACRPVFQKIVSNIELSASLRYKPRAIEVPLK